MKISSLGKFFICDFDRTINKKSHNQIFLWLCLSLSFAAFYSLLALQKAFSTDYVIADDARQHLFWMQRFMEPQLFEQDLIANYFQSLAPVGYANFYKFMAVLGISPILLSKFIPIVLCLITTTYIFGICLQIIPSPIAAFLASLLGNQCIWIHDDFASATSRAFLYPFFCAFTYYFLRSSLVGCLITTILLGLFYPPFVLISAGMTFLKLFEYRRGMKETGNEKQRTVRTTMQTYSPLHQNLHQKRSNNKVGSKLERFFTSFRWLRLTKSRRRYIFCGSILVASVIVLLPSVFKFSAYGPFISVAEARKLPEFLSSGRTSLFNDENPSRYWLSASRTGFRLAFNPPFLIFGLLLPLQLRFPKSFKLAKQVNNHIYILLYIFIVSLGLFFAAHALLFNLYLPSRYTVHTLRIILAIASSISIVLLIDALIRAGGKYRFVTTILTLFIAITIVFYPSLVWKSKFPATSYIIGKHTQLYKFLRNQPFDTLTASLSPEASNLPSFAQRPVLVSSEHAIPYHTGYYSQIRQRLSNLIQAQYSANLDDAKELIDTYGIDWWLLDTNSFQVDYIQNNNLLKQYLTIKLPEDELVKITTKVLNNLKKGEVPALSKLLNQCSVYQKDTLTLLSAECISKAN
ncbi:MAG: hypothetical protein AAF378_22345 [Cyanobacteria bacterium P01_A01_bin.84]